MSNNVLSKNDAAWESLFEKYDILGEIDKNGNYEITAEQIIEFREPRLMTKFDHTINLPELFSKNKLSILPITRGSYVISHFNAYHTFESTDASIVRASLPPYIQSLDSDKINSEAIALNCAVATGIIADFTEDEELISTVSGRMGSGKFSFDIKDAFSKSHHIAVENSQIEIDAAYEGIKYLSLFEAKRDLSDDFLIRQLYYPYRVWKERITKTVKPIFLVYSNGIYRMYEYRFENPNEYSSLSLVKQKNYSIEDTSITTEDIQKILKNVKIVDEPSVSFPQADSFERVINLCELLSENTMNRNEVTEQYAFNSRQTNYYTDAARYLGLLDKDKDGIVPIYSLSNLGKKILNLGFKQRQLSYCQCLLSHKIFNDVLDKYFKVGEMPDNNSIVVMMKNNNLYNMKSDKTFDRRASTIKHWIDWIIGLINE